MLNGAAPPKTIIIGAGPAGALVGIFLARHGLEVDVYERRADLRRSAVERGRSINLTLAARGLDALAKADVLDAVMRLTVPLRGRVIHAAAQAPGFQPYGRRPQEVTYAIRRGELQAALLTAAEALPNLRIRFNARCVGIDRDRSLVRLADERTGEAFTAESDFIIGADGAFSSVRPLLQEGRAANYHEEVHSYGYKELTIPAAPDGGFRLRGDALHVWPRERSMLIAIPNRDGSFTCTCILTHEDGVRLSQPGAERDVQRFFTHTFPDVVAFVPQLVEDFHRNPFSQFVSTRTAPWHYRDRVVLVGDAAHAVYPFLGQGMNAAFEDCLALAESLMRHAHDRTRAFAEYERLRKPNSDALDLLSRRHLSALRDQMRSSTIARTQIYDRISWLLPTAWVPLYTLITHTTIPYTDVIARWRRQERVARLVGVDVAVHAYAGLLTLRQLVIGAHQS
jgi:kynurenine 3-monooxygenase